MTIRRTALLAGAMATALLAAAPLSAQQVGEIRWFGSIYAKFLDGNRRLESALYNNAETTPGEAGGDQGQGIEFELMFNSQVSSQVEIGGRIKARFNQNFWTNFGGFGPQEQDERSAQYMKLRGAWARITPGYDWIDSATIGSNDWGMFDPWTVGKFRYIDRDNSSGLLFQGTVFDGLVRWDLARVSLSRLFQGPQFVTSPFSDNPFRRVEANDAAWIAQARWAATDSLNVTGILEHIRDKEKAVDPDVRDGQDVQTRYENIIAALKAQYGGFDTIDIGGAVYYTDFNVDVTECDENSLESCRFSPTPKASVDDVSWKFDLSFNELPIEDLTVSIQAFHIGADFVSVTSARREQDVLLTSGHEGTWGWGRPDYNFGSFTNTNSLAGLGYGGWNPETQQVVSMMADNDFTDFDEPMAETVIGWKGFTIAPSYVWNDWEFSGEYTYIDYDTNWQACGGTDKDVGCIYNRQEGTHSWGLGGDYRSPYAPYQEKETQIWGLTANYFLDIGAGVDLGFRFKYIADEDERVTNPALLADAYDGFPGAAGFALNPDWIPNVGLDGCVECDDREADYYTYLVSAGYQLTSDLYVRLVYRRDEVDLIDGTIDVAPVGLGFEASNDFGYAEYLTGEHVKNRVGLEFSYFLSGVEFGGSVDWFWGDYQPEFLDFRDGQIVLLDTSLVDTVATPLGNIDVSEAEYEQYRLKAFMKVSF